MRRLITLLVAVLLLTAVSGTQELLTRQLNLLELTEKAGTIVRGEVVAVAVEPHPDFVKVSTLKVTLRVSDSIYGASGPQVTFRSYVGPHKFGDAGGKSAARTGYRVGDELLLFLYSPSRYGFTSPVGDEQGLFRVIRQSGRSLVVNSLRNRGLFDGMETGAQAQGIRLTAKQAALIRQSAGPAELRSFTELVRQLAARKGSQ